ncbi:MAG: 3-phosphoglycerate dehydrogenase [Oscillospiraceae bacterium]|jgi:D-3-phosphoglycerate dehydrogenase|nr:3-phosphoglycerate dehydrogenase [Oscillospiraceae bacterium]
MPNILTLNKIAKIGLDEFPQGYVCGDSAEHPAAILVRSASLHETPLPESLLAIARAGAGVNNVPIETCTQQGICVFNTPGANANAVKELVIASLFLSSRKVAEGIAWCKTLKGEGENVGKLVEKGKGAFGGPEIFGKTLGLIGLGAIGGLVANAAAALGMRVIGVDPYLSSAAKAQLSPDVELTDDLDALLGRSDYISLHAPLTAETKGSVNAAFFAKAKPGVRVLNFSRADLVNSGDLLAALASGQCAAYVTDFPTDDLIGAAGVTAIPHLGASTPESEDNCAIMAARQVTAYLERGEVKNSVNLPATELPADFTTRVCVIHKASEAVPAVLQQALPAGLVSQTRGSVSYTVADFGGDAGVDPGTIAAIDGVLRVRVLRR